MRGTRNIVIVGGGASGTLVAAHLLRRASRALRISIIERQPRLGRGVAYGTSADCHLLNVPAGKMSAFPDDPDHFVRWARMHGRTDGGLVETIVDLDDWTPDDEVNAASFLPRRLYGAYLDAVLDDALAMAKPGVGLERFADEAVAINETSDGATVTLHGGELLEADAVVLALGHLPPRNPPLADPRFYDSTRYRGFAWADDALTDLPLDAAVLLVGAGLSAVDLALELRRRDHRGTIHLLSRRGHLPAVHRAATPYPAFIDAQAPPTTIAELVRRVRAEVTAASARGVDWRSVIDTLRPITSLVWQSLPLAERRRFLRHVRSYWETLRHRMAPEVAESITAMLQSGQLVLHTGRLERCVDRRHGVVAMISRRRTDERELIAVSRVINCTGPESDFRQFQNPLIVDLLLRGSIRPDPLALGLAVTPDGAILDVDGVPSRTLSTLGPTCKGTLWETTAIPEIRSQAAALAARLLEVGNVDADDVGARPGDAQVSSESYA